MDRSCSVQYQRSDLNDPDDNQARVNAGQSAVEITGHCQSAMREAASTEAWVLNRLAFGIHNSMKFGDMPG